MKQRFWGLTLFFTIFIGISVISITARHAFAAAVPTSAENPCPILYNGGEICTQAKDFTTNKTVLHPKNGSYVNDIPADEAQITAGNTIIFRIEITNTSNNALKNITITDTLPYFVDFIKADKTVDAKERDIIYKLESLEKGERSTLNIETKVVSTELLPNYNPICVANAVVATTTTGSQSGRDIVTFCINKQTSLEQPAVLTSMQQPIVPATTKGGQPVHPAPQTTQAPNTGPEALGILTLFSSGLLGFILRKKS